MAVHSCDAKTSFTAQTLDETRRPCQIADTHTYNPQPGVPWAPN